jgi:hypothetical protein
MGAMRKLSLANNELATEENAKTAGEALGDMLKGNVVLKELDVSSNGRRKGSANGVSFAVGISQGLSDNKALTSLDISNNSNIGRLSFPEGWEPKEATSEEEYDAHGGLIWYV